MLKKVIVNLIKMVIKKLVMLMVKMLIMLLNSGYMRGMKSGNNVLIPSLLARGAIEVDYRTNNL